MRKLKAGRSLGMVQNLLPTKYNNTEIYGTTTLLVLYGCETHTEGGTRAEVVRVWGAE
jgi:hypothetical protein